MMHHQSLGGPGPTELELELADIEALQKIKEAYKWDDQHKEYQKRLKALQKKWQLKKGNMPSEKQAMKEKFLWAEWGKKDADDFKEAVSFLPEIFGAGKYGTSGVHSRGGKQNYKDEWCAWKRFARDGRHFRVLEHTTGYFYQEGFLPSHTEEGEEEEDKEEEDKEEADDADDADKEPEPEPPAKKKKGDKRAEAPAEAAAASKAPKAAAKAGAKEAAMAPKRASKRGHGK
jgi:hypothetical protein